MNATCNGCGYDPSGVQASQRRTLIECPDCGRMLCEECLKGTALDQGQAEEDVTPIMTPSHPRWEEFAERLEEALRAETCDSTTLRLSTRLLGSMADIDVAKSVEYFRANGGYCDCEVLLNVDW